MANCKMPYHAIPERTHLAGRRVHHGTKDTERHRNF